MLFQQSLSLCVRCSWQTTIIHAVKLKADIRVPTKQTGRDVWKASGINDVLRADVSFTIKD